MPAPTHINEQIRAALVTALTGLTTTGSRIDQDILMVKSVADPRLVVRVATGSVETGVTGFQQRVVEIIVAGYAKESASLSAVLGAIEYEVEVAMYGAGTLGNLLGGGIVLRRTERGISDELEKPAGVITMEFAAMCFTQSGTPGVVA